MMKLYDNINFKIYKFLLLGYGLCPYQNRMQRLVAFVSFNLVILSLICAYTIGLEENSTPLVKLENIVAVIYLFAALLQFTMMHMMEGNIAKLFDQFLLDWKNMDNEEENILIKRTENGRKKVSYLFFYSVPAFSIFAFITSGLPTFIIAQPHGITTVFPHYWEDMIIFEEYRQQQIFFHSFVSLIISGFFYYTTCAFYVICANHVCGIYEIARYRLKIAVKSSPKTSESGSTYHDSNLEEKIYSQLTNVVLKHNGAIHEVKLLEEVFSTAFLLVQTVAFAALGILIYDIISNKGDMLQVMRPMFIIPIFVTYLYFLNWSGQQVLQISSDMSLYIYLTEWLTLPLKCKKLLIAIMQRSSRPEKLTAGSLWAMSLTNFGWVLQGSWSFASILLSAKNKV